MVRDLEFLIPPNFMFFRRASFWTCPKKHTNNNIIELLGQTGAGVGTGWSGDGAGDGDEAGDGAEDWAGDGAGDGEQ